MNLIFELSIKEAKPLPDFHGTDTDFVRLTLNGIVISHEMLSVINQIGNERLESLTTNDFLVINALFYEKKLSPNLKLRVKRLVDMGIVEHSGHNRYILARRLYKAIGKAGVHTRLTGLDRGMNKELILKHLRESAGRGVPLNEIYDVLPSHNRGQLQVLLRELKREGRVFCVGRTKAAKWFIETKNRDTINKEGN